jgi:ribosome-binding ATPase YchF (GTP1/OBG family)
MSELDSGEPVEEELDSPELEIPELETPELEELELEPLDLPEEIEDDFPEVDSENDSENDIEVIEPEEEIEEAEEIEESIPEIKAVDKSENPEIPTHLKKELKTVLSYMDQLLEALPDNKIEEFARSSYYETYKKLFKDLGLV